MKPEPPDYAATQLLWSAIVDLEASGLGSASFTTEIGWTTINDDGSITSDAA